MSAPGTSDWWASLVSNDPLFAMQQNQANDDDRADQRARDQGVARQLIQYGDVSGALNSAKGLGLDFSQIATPETQAAAQALTNSGLSTYARNQVSDQDARRGITNTLAASGILNSGETGFRMGRQDLTNAQTQFGSIQSLLDYLQGAQQGYLDHQRSRQSSLFAAGQAAADRIAKLNAGAATDPKEPGQGGGGPGGDPVPPGGNPPSYGPDSYPATTGRVLPTAYPSSSDLFNQAKAAAGANLPVLGAQTYKNAIAPTNQMSVPVPRVTVPKVTPPTAYSTYKNQVKVAPGQTLHFTAGRGYYSA